MSSFLYFTAATRRSSADEYLSFLDYPHAHDPTSISDIAALSTDLLRQLPTEAQDSLWLLQESTSVVHSSYARLQNLLEEKFERLSYRPQERSYSEHAFANYANQLTAERGYLLHDAYLDWKHKVSIIRLDPYLDISFNYRNEYTTVRDWFAKLQDSVTEWLQEALAVQAPDFDETVLQYTSQSTTPTSVASSDSLTKALEVSSSLSKPRQTTMKHGVGNGDIENVIETNRSYGTQATR